MQLFSEDDNTNYVELTSLLGLYFQVRDDYANLCMEDMHDNKSFAEDLTEGKFSFPIVHAITYVLLMFQKAKSDIFFVKKRTSFILYTYWEIVDDRI